MGNSAGQDVDPTFYRTPSDAINAPPEQLAYVVAFDRAAQQPDALAVLGTDPGVARVRAGRRLGRPADPGNELHHFGWNACSGPSAHAGHRAEGLRRRYLLPGIRSSEIHVYDTHPDPGSPRWSGRSPRTNWRRTRATRVRTPLAAAPTGSSRPASAAGTEPTARVASRCSTMTPSTCRRLGPFLSTHLL